MRRTVRLGVSARQIAGSDIALMGSADLSGGVDGAARRGGRPYRADRADGAARAAPAGAQPEPAAVFARAFPAVRREHAGLARTGRFLTLGLWVRTRPTSTAACGSTRTATMSRSNSSPSSLARCCRCRRRCLASSSPSTIASLGTAPPPHDGPARRCRRGHALAGRGHPGALSVASMCLTCFSFSVYTTSRNLHEHVPVSLFGAAGHCGRDARAGRLRRRPTSSTAFVAPAGGCQL